MTIIEFVLIKDTFLSFPPYLNYCPDEKIIKCQLKCHQYNNLMFFIYLKFFLKNSMCPKVDVINFELVVVVDFELLVALVPLDPLVPLVTLQRLHIVIIRYALYDHVHVYACKKTMEQLENHNILNQR